MRPLSPKARALVDDVLAAYKGSSRFRVTVNVDEDGTHCKGAINSERVGQCAATIADVRALRAALRRTGAILSFDEADALISEALWHDADGKPWYTRTRTYTITGRNQRAVKTYATKADYVRAKRRRRIERLRAAGLCIVCGGNKVRNRSTCTSCSKASVLRKARARGVRPKK